MRLIRFILMTVASLAVLAPVATPQRAVAPVVGDLEVNVRALGATGNGSTDDLAAFRSALASGGSIFLPCGTYYLSAAWVLGPSNSGVRIRGAGPCTNLVGHGGNVINLVGNGGASFPAGWVRNIAISDMTISSTSGTGLYLKYTSDCTFERIYAGAGIRTQAFILAEPSIASKFDAIQASTDQDPLATWGYGMWLRSNNADPTRTSDHNTILHPYITGMAVNGFLLANGHFNTLLNGTVQNNANDIEIGDAGNTIEGSHSEGQGSPPAYAFIKLDDGADATQLINITNNSTLQITGVHYPTVDVQVYGGGFCNVRIGPGVNHTSFIGTQFLGGSLCSIADGGTATRYINSTILATGATLDSYVTAPPGIPPGCAQYPCVVATLDLTHQSAAIANRTFYAVPSGQGGTYQASCYVVVTQAAAVSSTAPRCAMNYVDQDTGAAENAVQPLSSNSAANMVGAVMFSSAVDPQRQYLHVAPSSNIQFSASGYASTGAPSMQYAIHAVLTYLHP